MTLTRWLFCPICGARVTVELDRTENTFPEVHRLPEHEPAGNANPHPGFAANVCAGCVITVTIDFDKCAKCGARMGKHPSGVCRDCYEPERPRKYATSRFVAPVPGVMLGCITPEARDLLDEIMAAYREHYERGKKFHKPEHQGPEPDTVYRFAYWLVRWSGLVRPMKVAP